MDCSVLVIDEKRFELSRRTVEVDLPEYASSSTSEEGDVDRRRLVVSYDVLRASAYEDMAKDLPKDADITGMADWDGLALFGHFFCKLPKLIRGSRILELGSGGSCAGLVAAATGLPAEVLLTDYSPQVLALARHNVRMHLHAHKHASPTQVERVDWGDSKTHDVERKNTFSVVFGSEILYYVTRVDSLLSCALHYLDLESGVFCLFSNVRDHTSLKRLEDLLRKQEFKIVYLRPRSIADWARFESEKCLVASRNAKVLRAWTEGFDVCEKAESTGDSDW